MPESATINPNFPPLTRDSLAEQFAACGLAAGQTVLVHSSLSKLGWVVGGAQDVIQALLDVLTPSGTLMMPSHTGGNGDPAYWRNPPVPAWWYPTIRQHRPAYDPQLSPTRAMGAIAELFRTWPGVCRSGHPIGSFAALGPQAADLTANHPLEPMFGDDSPIGRLYACDGYVLLLGVDHGNNTSLHLAEYRADFPGKSLRREGTAMLVNGERQWVEFDMLSLNDEDFPTIGDNYESEHGIPRGQVGQAVVRFMKQRPLVDYGVEWMAQNRDFARQSVD
ncbi:MAG: AAC(3) family N-acetyltransferase [Anaerolineaceae bacterium]|nr:AAC(3) family N-acetyltransferase [Anaerolineaceae bacterium]